MMPHLAGKCRKSVAKQVRGFGFCIGASYRREEGGGDFRAKAESLWGELPQVVTLLL